jgi:uncharacterized membrane protein
MNRSSNPKTFLTAEETQQLDSAVRQAEKQTSGEIKVVLTRHCWADLRAKAAQVFKKHGLDKTERRNCAMIMMVLANREFLIYGDEGIHEKVGQDFWDDVRDTMLDKFKEGEFGEGLCVGVQRIGEKLAQFFPYRADDKDEISDDVAFED